MDKRRNNLGTKLLLGLLLIAIIAVAGYFISRNLAMEEKTTITSEMVEESLKEAKELTTTKYHYKNIASYENSQEFYGFKVPFTSKRFIYTYEGTINAGVDLDQAKVDVNDEGKIITVSLPETRILSHEIDEDSVMMFDEKESVFNQLKLEDFSTFRAEEKVKVESEALEKGLLDEAKEQTRKAITEILNINPDIEDGYTINIKY